MKPIDYIYKNLDSFNISIFQQIVEESGEEVSESIYDYLMETTWNTNPALLKQFGLDIERSSEEEGVVLFEGEIVTTNPKGMGFGINNDTVPVFNSSKIAVTIDGVTYILNATGSEDYHEYGYSASTYGPTFDNYPFSIICNQVEGYGSEFASVYTENAGTFFIKIVAIE